MGNKIGLTRAQQASKKLHEIKKMEKIKTITLDFRNGEMDLIDTNIQSILDVLKAELTETKVEEGEEVEFIITVKRDKTQEEFENLPDWN